MSNREAALGIALGGVLVSAMTILKSPTKTDHPEATAELIRTCADLLRRLLEAWWSRLSDDAVGGIIKLVFSEVRNYPQLMEFWLREVVEPGRRLIGQVLHDGMERGEFRRMDPDVVVRSLVLPMIMGCLHKQNIGACNRTSLRGMSSSHRRRTWQIRPRSQDGLVIARRTPAFLQWRLAG